MMLPLGLVNLVRGWPILVEYQPPDIRRDIGCNALDHASVGPWHSSAWLAGGIARPLHTDNRRGNAMITPEFERR